MKKLLHIILLTTFTLQVNGQFFPSEKILINPYDSVMLSSLPELEIPAFLKATSLPYCHDNSTLKYYRPIYEQLSAECGQVSGIAYNFTYEINRLRDLPASEEENQYTPNFTYNFMNGGLGWNGVSYFHSFEILRLLGCPTVATYGGMSAGGVSRWMSGYDNYYASMKNRIRSAYQIQVGTPEGLMTLKHWLHNHLDGSEIGGVASFYSNAPWNLRTLPEGTPEGGKRVIIKWGGEPSHAMCITGYNDSIRYDYNGDGLYTNDIDINDDGVIDMRDWEIGGLLFADGWGGINFADSGKCYMLYRTLAENTWSGGIWNHAVHILDVKDLETPKLTARITLEHTCRNRIRVQCGVSGDPDRNTPEYILGFPVFNFQGGSQYMQGGHQVEENKTIEFGLDITPLLGYIDSGEINKFFLIVEERDSNDIGQGAVKGFSIIDYSDVPLEKGYQDTIIPIINNNITYVPILWSEPLNELNIATNYLPPAVIDSNYSFQLEHNGGSEPFQWNLIQEWNEIQGTMETGSGGLFVEPDNWNYGNIAYPLPFDFPFYDEVYNTIYIHPDGFIMFEDTQFPWPYLWDEHLMIRKTKCIAPFLSQRLSMVPAFGQGIWVDQSMDHVRIRWIAEIDDYNYYPEISFEAILNADGSVSFVYGSNIHAWRTYWSCGVSYGDDMNYCIPAIENQEYITENEAVHFSPIPLPEEMKLSKEGLFYGTPSSYYDRVELQFCLEDDNNVRAFKTLEFSSTELGVSLDNIPERNVICYPNPFRKEVNIKFENFPAGMIRCRIYTLEGKLIKTLVDAPDYQKDFSISWNACRDDGTRCPTGMYIIQWISGEESGSAKVLLKK